MSPLERRPLGEVSQDLGEAAGVAVGGWDASNEGVGRIAGQGVGVDREPGRVARTCQEPGDRVVWERGSKRREWAHTLAVDREIGVTEREPHHAAVRADVIWVDASEQRFAVGDVLSQERLSRPWREGLQRAVAARAAPGLG